MFGMSVSDAALRADDGAEGSPTTVARAVGSSGSEGVGLLMTETVNTSDGRFATTAPERTLGYFGTSLTSSERHLQL